MSVRQLSLFNERAKKLADSRFLAWLKARGNKQPDISRVIGGDWLAYEDLNSEDLDSFCLNLRLLIQDRDGFSIRCLSQVYEQFPKDYEEAKRLFFEETRKLNEYLEERAFVQLPGRNSLTHKELLNIVLYGGIAHNDEKYYSDFVRMTKAGFFSVFTFITLWNIVFKLNTCIQRIAILNEEVIQWEMESNKPMEPTR